MMARKKWDIRKAKAYAKKHPEKTYSEICEDLKLPITNKALSMALNKRKYRRMMPGIKRARNETKSRVEFIRWLENGGGDMFEEKVKHEKVVKYELDLCEFGFISGLALIVIAMICLAMTTTFYNGTMWIEPTPEQIGFARGFCIMLWIFVEAIIFIKYNKRYTIYEHEKEFDKFNWN